MSTIRKPSWKDLLRIPAFDLGDDGKIILPSNVGMPHSWGPYCFVAEGPGGNIMGFVCTTIHMDGSTEARMISIDTCRTNRKYQEVEPLEGLIAEVEKIVLELQAAFKAVSAIEVCLPGDTTFRTLNKYYMLGYQSDQPEMVVTGQERILLRKNFRPVQEAAAEARHAFGQVDAARHDVEQLAAAAAAEAEAAAAAEQVALAVKVLGRTMFKQCIAGLIGGQASPEGTEGTGSSAPNLTHEEAGEAESPETSTSYAPTLPPTRR